jgi:1,4-dihydroxy-2-naphthoate octaprenyltransferase
MLSTVLIAINNLRDIEEDTKTGKRTLAVRFGKKFARWEIALLSLVPYALSVYWWIAKGWIMVVALTLWLAFLASRLLLDLFDVEPSPVYNKFLAKAGAILVVFALMTCLGFYRS